MTSHRVHNEDIRMISTAIAALRAAAAADDAAAAAADDAAAAADQQEVQVHHAFCRGGCKCMPAATVILYRNDDPDRYPNPMCDSCLRKEFALVRDNGDKPEDLYEVCRVMGDDVNQAFQQWALKIGSSS